MLRPELATLCIRTATAAAALADIEPDWLTVMQGTICVPAKFAVALILP
jgi:hypothetical protein